MQFDDMVCAVVGWIESAPEELQSEFRRCAKKNLIRYHHGLGTEIRNEFKLWEKKWEPEIINGIDVSDDHPDSISMRVIEEAWRKINS